MNLERALKVKPGWTKPAELAWLAWQANKSKKILELGSFHGRSTRAMLDNSAAHIWCVDTWAARITKGTTATDKDYEGFLTVIGEHRDRVTVLRTSTKAAEPQLLEVAPFDLVFIDADHTYEWVKHDILAYAPMVRSGGILCGHDYFHKAPGLMQAVDELIGPCPKVHTIWGVRLSGGNDG